MRKEKSYFGQNFLETRKYFLETNKRELPLKIKEKL